MGRIRKDNMEERKTGFEACKECFGGEPRDGQRNGTMCRIPSDACPPIPDHIPDDQVIRYLKANIVSSMKEDMVDHPPHYNNNPSGVECIEVTEHMSFNIGNAVKYLWRVDQKVDTMEDIDKAIWYLNREKLKRTNEMKKNG